MPKKPEPKQAELDAQLHAMMMAVGAVQEDDAPAASAPQAEPGPNGGKASGWGPRSK